MGNTHDHKKNGFLFQVLATIYKLQKNFRASFFFKSKQN